MTDAVSVSLYGHWICPFVTRVEFALAQREIAYDLIEVPPTAVRPRDFVMPELFELHSPKREIPMLRIGHAFLADSIPILEWMEREFASNPMLPADTQGRDLVRERVAWLDAHMFRSMIGIYYGTDPVKISIASDRLAHDLAGIAEWLGDQRWLAGDAPTLAEAVMVPLYVRMAGLQRLGFTGAIPPAIAAHRERCALLDSWSVVRWSDAQTDELVARFEKFRVLNAAT